MLKKICCLLIVYLPLSLWAQESTTLLDSWPDFKEVPYASKKVDGHDFTIVVTDLPETQLILGYHYANKMFTKDTAITDGSGVAHFSGPEDLDGGVYLIALNGSILFEFVYSCTEKGFTLTTDSKDPLNNMKIKGSDENKWFIDYQKNRVRSGRKQSALKKRYQKFKKANLQDSIKSIEVQSEKLSKANKAYDSTLVAKHPRSMAALMVNLLREPTAPSPPPSTNGQPVDTALWKFIYFKKHYWDRIDFSDDRILRTPVFRRKVGKYIGEQMTLQIPDSICVTARGLIDEARKGNKMVYRNVLTWIMSKYETSPIMGMNAVVCCLGQKYYINDPEVDWIEPKKREKVVEMVANECNVVIGKQARDLIMLDTLRIPRSLHAVQADYTIVYFYSATCGHCKKTTPKIKKIYDEYKERGVRVYAVNTDYKDIKNDNGEVINRVETKEYKEYIRKNKFGWTDVADPLHQTQFRDYYNINSTPVIYLLDKNKMFVGVKLDAITLRKLLLLEIDGLSGEEIETWMQEHGYVEEAPEKGKKDAIEQDHSSKTAH